MSSSSFSSLTGGASGLANIYNSIDIRRIWNTVDETLHNKNVIYALVGLMTLYVVFFHSNNPVFINNIMGNELGRVLALILVAFLTSISPLLGVFAALVYIVAAFNTGNRSEGFTDNDGSTNTNNTTNTSQTSNASATVAGGNTTAAKASTVQEEILCLDRSVTDHIPAEHREKIDQLKSFKYPSKQGLIAKLQSSVPSEKREATKLLMESCFKDTELDALKSGQTTTPPVPEQAGTAGGAISATGGDVSNFQDFEGEVEEGFQAVNSFYGGGSDEYQAAGSFEGFMDFASF